MCNVAQVTLLVMVARATRLTQRAHQPRYHREVFFCYISWFNTIFSFKTSSIHFDNIYFKHCDYPDRPPASHQRLETLQNQSSVFGHIKV